MATDNSVPGPKLSKGSTRPADSGRASAPAPQKRHVKYLREVMAELRKATWPTKPELISQTQVVIGLLFAVGIYIFLWDKILSIVIGGILTALGAKR